MIHTRNGEKTGAFQGDAIEFTGRIEVMHGGVFHEFRYTEGCHVGEIGWNPRHIVGFGTIGLADSSNPEDRVEIKAVLQALLDAPEHRIEHIDIKEWADARKALSLLP